ncbi:FHA domain-containing protein [Pseudomonas sp. DCB_BI]|uniref:FHA domain-containing protein n=1 Tax=Pseudomonas sp. DCB_BI TaxID=2993594 RepID=UPI00224A915A|nr:FHA domain-containing protein [Pseudomonas sp. DCB_BI]MCX2890164.1 FHA domain-containing protein [Pseudomonas sp. DCB_BI]
MSTLTLNISNLDCLEPDVVARHQFDSAGGTIGSAAVTWQINDRERTIAPIHCEIRWIEGGFCVIDHCNRTYLNSSILSLGFRSARRLVEGDQLHVGACRLQVRLARADTRSLPDLFAPGPRLIDRLIADVPAETCPAKPPATQVAVDICSIFGTPTDKDPLVALDAKSAAVWTPENSLPGLIPGDRS